MAMNMREAFDSEFLVVADLYKIGEGDYDTQNLWVPASATQSVIRARILSGNKFSQFEEGIARRVMDDGVRFSDYISVYVTTSFNVELEDKIGWNGKFYNILQKSDEAHFGFVSFLAEKSEDWSPP